MTVDLHISIPLLGGRQQCSVFDFSLSSFLGSAAASGCFSGHLQQALVSHPDPGDYYGVRGYGSFMHDMARSGNPYQARDIAQWGVLTRDVAGVDGGEMDQEVGQSRALGCWYLRSQR